MMEAIAIVTSLVIAALRNIVAMRQTVGTEALLHRCRCSIHWSCVFSAVLFEVRSSAQSTGSRRMISESVVVDDWLYRSGYLRSVFE